jgi:hypothetical protein
MNPQRGVSQLWTATRGTTSVTIGAGQIRCSPSSAIARSAAAFCSAAW